HNPFRAGRRGKLIEKWKAWFDRYFGSEQHKKRKYMLIIAAIGLMIMLISNLFSSMNEQSQKPQEPKSMEEVENVTEVSLKENVDELETEYKADLEAMLNEINGVKKAELIVNNDATNEQVYAKELIRTSQTTDKTDKNGGERKVEDESEETELFYVRSGEEELPVVVQTKKPDVRGVFVIAEGAEKPEVKKWINESVSRVLDVPSHRISVMPK